MNNSYIIILSKIVELLLIFQYVFFKGVNNQKNKMELYVENPST